MNETYPTLMEANATTTISWLNDTANLTDLNCPIHSQEDDRVVNELGFWLEGVVQCCVAILGLIGNFISALILLR